MRVILSPQRNDMPVPVVSVSGAVLTIDGSPLDFSGLAPGADLISSEIGNDYAISAQNVDGLVIVTLISPLPADANEAQRARYEYDIDNGVVEFPAASGQEEPEEPPVDPDDDDLAVERSTMVVSRFQAKAALLASDLLVMADAAVATSDSAFVRLAWAEATEWRRLSPTIAAMQAAIGLSDIQVDDLFRAAALIEA